MKIIISTVACVLTATLLSPAAAIDFPDRDHAGVVDAAHVMPAAAAFDLNRRVVAWDRATGHQFVVATVPSLQGNDIATYGYQLGRAWGLGRKGINDGLILLLAPNERKVRIEVGRGLEPDLTDAETSIIIHDTIVPKLKADDVAGALSDGADAIMAAVPANAGDLSAAPRRSHPAGGILLALLMLTGIGAAVVIIIRRRSRAVKAATTPPRGADRPFLGVDRPARGYRSSPTIAPIIVDNSSFQPFRRRDDDYSPPISSWPSSSDSSSSSDSGSSSSGFDSGDGGFGGGGSDSSY